MHVTGIRKHYHMVSSAQPLSIVHPLQTQHIREQHQSGGTQYVCRDTNKSDEPVKIMSFPNQIANSTHLGHIDGDQSPAFVIIQECSKCLAQFRLHNMRFCQYLSIHIINGKQCVPFRHPLARGKGTMRLDGSVPAAQPGRCAPRRSPRRQRGPGQPHACEGSPPSKVCVSLRVQLCR